jgi:hyperosmotically inducible periplasmic protein
MRAYRRLVSIAALTFAVGACSQRPDPTEQAEKALQQANINGVNVDWDDEARIAHLQGTVESATDRQRAEDVTTAAVGTSGTVLNELTVKGLNDEIADDLDGRIRNSLDQMIDRDQTLKERDVNFDVANGVVTVKGEVRTAAEKARVTEIVRSAPGVKDFANALDIEAEK